MATVFLQLSSQMTTGEEVFPKHKLFVWAKIENNSLPNNTRARGILDLKVRGPEVPQPLFTISWRFTYVVNHHKQLGKVMVGAARILDNENLTELKKFRERYTTNLKKTGSLVKADRDIVSIIIDSMKRADWVVEPNTKGKTFNKWLLQHSATA